MWRVLWIAIAFVILVPAVVVVVGILLMLSIAALIVSPFLGLGSMSYKIAQFEFKTAHLAFNGSVNDVYRGVVYMWRNAFGLA